MQKIRKTTPNDSDIVAELMLLAMRDITHDFIGSKDDAKAKEFLKDLIQQKNNQYSFENTYVLEYENNIVGSFTLYDGGKLNELRKPVLDLLKEKFYRDIQPQDETESGEIYIDTIAVFPEYRGKGFGNSILDYIIEEIAHKQNQTIGLLVDFTNPKAKKLYESKGFKVVGEKQLMSENHEHMQYKKGV